MRIDGMTEEEMLSLLTEEQRIEFGITLQDSIKSTALVTEEFIPTMPWWEKQEDLEEEEIVEDSLSVPEIVTESLLPPLRLDEQGKPIINPGMVYNTVAIL